MKLPGGLKFNPLERFQNKFERSNLRQDLFFLEIRVIEKPSVKYHSEAINMFGIIRTYTKHSFISTYLLLTFLIW